MTQQDNIRVPVTKLEVCPRCKRPLLREHLPIMGIMQAFEADGKQIRSVLRGMQHAQIDNLPPALLSMYSDDAFTFTHVLNGARLGFANVDKPLCFRCWITVAGVLENLSEEEEQFYKAIDATEEVPT